MKKKLADYHLIIADLDGTLYYQPPVRLCMLVVMTLRFYKFHEFLMIQKYRKLYERGLSDKERYAVLPEGAREKVAEWMLIRPLPFVKMFRDKRLITLLEFARADGAVVVVYSDYPVTDKLSALSFAPDAAYSADDLDCLKPDAGGLRRILDEYGAAPAGCLIIGDRQDKDGKLAENLGLDCIILPQNPFKRKKIYELLGM